MATLGPSASFPAFYTGESGHTAPYRYTIRPTTCTTTRHTTTHAKLHATPHPKPQPIPHQTTRHTQPHYTPNLIPLQDRNTRGGRAARAGSQLVNCATTFCAVCSVYSDVCSIQCLILCCVVLHNIIGGHFPGR